MFELAAVLSSNGWSCRQLTEATGPGAMPTLSSGVIITSSCREKKGSQGRGLSPALGQHDSCWELCARASENPQGIIEPVRWQRTWVLQSNPALPYKRVEAACVPRSPSTRGSTQVPLGGSHMTQGPSHFN